MFDKREAKVAGASFTLMAIVALGVIMISYYLEPLIKAWVFGT